MNNAARYLAFLVVWSSVLAQALEAQPKRIEAQLASEVEFTVNSAELAQGSPEIILISKGTISVPFSATLNGPGGLKATVEGKALRGDLAQALASRDGWFEIRTERPLTIRQSTQATTYTSSEKYCDQFPPDQLQQVRDLLRILLGREPTDQEVCTLLGGGALGDSDSGSYNSGNPPTSEDGDGYVRSSGIIRKDTCNSRATRYAIRVRLDLSSVDQAALQNGVTISAEFLAPNYRGRMASKLKAHSDGKFAPGAISLHDSIGGKQTLSIYKFSGGKPRKIFSRGIADTVYYNGHALTRTPIGSVLRGGRGVFELSNGYSAYSVCFRLSAVDQYANGYPR